MSARFAVIGGTGTGVNTQGELVDEQVVDTPFGAPSAPLRQFLIDGRPVWFLPRHGDGHQIAPHLVNYAANLTALHDVGVTHVIALNAVGIIGRRAPVGGLLIPNQIIDYTWGRRHTVRDGDVAVLDHIDFTEPYSEELRGQLLAAAQAVGLEVADGGVYGATQGPRLETAAEVARLARDGVEVIGMTGMPEASIARELDLSYACIALIVNEAAGQGEGDIHAQLHAAMDQARSAANLLLASFFETIFESKG
ncbi:MAG: S-methyl-5'-thioinosine phosphorylase [Pseudomonadota bacterium]